jgi:hypothetical protein
MTRRPRGRPKLKDEDRRSEPVSVRLTPALRKQLEEARRSPDGDNTLSQEIELRLRRSFNIDGEIAKKFGTPGAYAFARMIADGIETVEILCSSSAHDDVRRWLDDRFTFDQVVMMINELLSLLRPGGRSMKPKYHNPVIGKVAAEQLVLALNLAYKNPELSRDWEGDSTHNMLTAVAVPLLRRFRFKKSAR